MSVEIRETIVTPSDGYDVVQLRISDAPLDDVSASLQITILAKLRPLQTPTLAHLQQDAMKMAQDAFVTILRGLAKELQNSGYGAEVPYRRPTL